MDRVASFYAQRINRIIGLHIDFKSADGPQFQLLQLRTQHQQLSITESGLIDATATDLQDYLQKNDQPIVCFISGLGVLESSIQNADTLNDALQQFSYGATQDFWHEWDNVASDGKLYSFRKDRLQAIVNELGIQKKCLHIHIKPAIANGLVSLLHPTEKEGVYTLHNYKLKYSENDLLTIETVSKPGVLQRVQIGDEVIDERQAMAFSAALNFIANRTVILDDGVVSEIIQPEEASHYYLFNKLKVPVLACLLLLLLGNFLFFSIQNHRNQRLNEEFVLKQAALDEITGKQLEIEQKQDFIQLMNWGGGSKASYYLDRTAALIPPDINLLELSVYPLDQLDELTGQYLFLSNRLSIKGTTRTAASISGLESQLLEQDWVVNSSIKAVNYDERSEFIVFEMELEIGVQHEL